MFEKDIYKKGVALGMAAFLGGCASPHKGNEAPRPKQALVQNVDPQRQPKVPLLANKCLEFTMELEPGIKNGQEITDIEGKTYTVSNRGHWVSPEDKRKGLKSLNTVQFEHGYEDNEGRQHSVAYVYNYGAPDPNGVNRFKFSNGDGVRVMVTPTEDVVGLNGWTCVG